MFVNLHVFAEDLTEFKAEESTVQGATHIIFQAGTGALNRQCRFNLTGKLSELREVWNAVDAGLKKLEEKPDPAEVGPCPSA